MFQVVRVSERDSKSPKPKASSPSPHRKKAGKRRSKRKTLSDRLAERLDDLARDIPYAAQLAEKLRTNGDETTLGDVIVDIMCMFAIKGNATILRSLWERSDGRPTGQRDDGQAEPRRIRMPLAEPGEPKE